MSRRATRSDLYVGQVVDFFDDQKRQRAGVVRQIGRKWIWVYYLGRKLKFKPQELWIPKEEDSE